MQHVHLPGSPVGKVQSGHYGLHVGLDGLGPLLQVPEALQALVEALHQAQPLGCLLHIAGRVGLDGNEGRESEGKVILDE